MELERLWEPFTAAITANVDAVMITHAAYPALDFSKPSTFSEKIIRDILRNQLNFSGLIISDDLEMGAISKNYTIEESAKACLDAGCDLLIISKDVDLQQRAFDAIKERRQ